MQWLGKSNLRWGWRGNKGFGPQGRGDRISPARSRVSMDAAIRPVRSLTANRREIQPRMDANKTQIFHHRGHEDKSTIRRFHRLRRFRFGTSARPSELKKHFTKPN